MGGEGGDIFFFILGEDFTGNPPVFFLILPYTIGPIDMVQFYSLCITALLACSVVYHFSHCPRSDQLRRAAVVLLISVTVILTILATIAASGEGLGSEKGLERRPI